ncbi:hypothetical protein [Streptomyces sp. ALI-76-A]|uniref:hypothetical protein n=1 Tax=Streptomyces sp. ALI-76-A TaxID=3025736 RepID=UPI00256EF751|nr:hypothetical protein [Streptomyces sp. ALI-76-A]MDL5204134.1 hypothetical protein [Streptomyces sp. ALI-76-A]
MTEKQHEADFDRVERQNGVTDVVRGIEERPPGGFLNRMIRSAVVATPYGRTVADRTDFEKSDLDLNALVDLVEQTNPEDLESSGKALWDARDAIKAAADELSGHIGTVPWVGESGDSFRTWGTALVENTNYLSEFAGAAGDQITAAAMGLASVRGSMPSRDTDPNRKRPEQFSEAEKAANKDEYAAAVRVEKDRQEAINQMNRLASYYAVSEEMLSALPDKKKTPTFEAMPDVGVPQPVASNWKDSSNSATGSQGGITGTASPSGHHATATGEVARDVASDTPRPVKDVTDKIMYPDDTVGTNIDSVGTLPPPTASPVTGQNPPVLGTSTTGGGQTGMFDGRLGTPLPNGRQGRSASGVVGRTPASTQGRAGTPGLTNSGSGRSAGQGPINQMGRATSTGQVPAKGTASASKSFPMGQGISGGTPRADGTATPRASGGPTTGAGRSNGVVGGRPATTGSAVGSGGSRVPRGTVVGGEAVANSRSATGRPSQRGVFGGPESTTRSGPSGTTSRAGAGTPQAVTGRPSARNSLAGAERNGMTRGGAGLVRGPGPVGKPGEEETARGSTRPDYLVEDEETHLPNNPRRDVPPVVN